jgi:HEAT repeat protein
MQGTDKPLAAVAAEALGKLQVAPDLALPALRKSVHGADAHTKALAMRASGEYGERAREAIPELLEVLNSEDWSLRNEATNALKKIQVETTITNNFTTGSKYESPIP